MKESLDATLENVKWSSFAVSGVFCTFGNLLGPKNDFTLQMYRALGGCWILISRFKDIKDIPAEPFVVFSNNVSANMPKIGCGY